MAARGQLGKLDAITQLRRARLGLLASGLPGLLLGFLTIGFVVFVALLYPASMSNAMTRTLMSGATAAVIAFAIVLTIVLNFPFSGALRTGTANYRVGALAQFWINPAPVTVKPDAIARWQSDSFFSVVVFRRVGDQIHAAYRKDLGTINGAITADGVFRGVWCQEPGRRPPDAGIVEFRLLKDARGRRPVVHERTMASRIDTACPRRMEPHQDRHATPDRPRRTPQPTRAAVLAEVAAKEWPVTRCTVPF